MTRLSDVEICNRWELAIDKKRELDRLAVACRTDRRGMVAKLRELGLAYEEPGPPDGFEPYEPRKRGGSHPRMDREAAMELYNEGLTDGRIAKLLGVVPQTVGSWRRAAGLPAHGVYLGNRRKTLTTGRDESYEPCLHPEREACGGCEQAGDTVVDPPANEQTVSGERDGSADGPRFRLETPVKVAREVNGMRVDHLAEIFTAIDKAAEGCKARVTAGGRTVVGVTVTLRYTGRSIDGPDEVSVDLEVYNAAALD